MSPIGGRLLGPAPLRRPGWRPSAGGGDDALERVQAAVLDRLRQLPEARQAGDLHDAPVELPRRQRRSVLALSPTYTHDSPGRGIWWRLGAWRDSMARTPARTSSGVSSSSEDGGRRRDAPIDARGRSLSRYWTLDRCERNAVSAPGEASGIRRVAWGAGAWPHGHNRWSSRSRWARRSCARSGVPGHPPEPSPEEGEAITVHRPSGWPRQAQPGCD